jgi:DNA-binding SARP family transcriptional activator
MKHLELRCFGPPAVLLDGNDPPADVLWRRHLALLVYLALSPELSRSRQHLMGVFWPDKPHQRARHSLNEAVRRLRASLGSRRLISRGESIALSAFDLDVDVLSVEAEKDRDQREAARLLVGEFLEGFAVDEARPFEEWADVQRDRYRTLGVDLHVKLGEEELARSMFVAAQDHARIALALNPVHEPAADVLMRAAAFAGDSTTAISVFEEFLATLELEFGSEPSDHLCGLAERVRSESWHRIPSRADAEPALVGRPKTYQEAFSLLREGLTSGPRTMVVTSDAGMGKTRLLNECLRRATLAGAVDVTARPLESDHDAAWSTLRALMRAGLAIAPGLTATDPKALAVLASLVPELAVRFEQSEATDVAHVAAALRSLISAVVDERPLVIAVDDADYADRQTLEALRAAFEQMNDACCVLILTMSATSEGTPKALLKLKGEVGRSLPGAMLQLESFDHAEMRTLVELYASWFKTEEELDRLARRIMSEAGGNPFFAVTLLEKLDKATTLKDDLMRWPPPEETLDSPLPFTIPELTRMAIVAGVAQLESNAKEVLKVASVIGSALEPELLAAVCGLSVNETEAAMDELERERFVVYDGERYVFGARLIPDVVRSECLTPGVRGRVRRRAIEHLAERTDLAARLLRTELLARLGPSEEAFTEAVTTAQTAIDSGAGRAARRALDAAERVAGENRQATMNGLRLKLEE